MSATRRLEFIARTQLSGAAASVSFANLDTDFRKVFVVAYLVADASAQNWTFRINNDSGANYAKQYLSANAASVAGARGTGGASWQLDGLSAIKGSNVGMFVMEISKPVAGEVARATWRFGYMNNDATALIQYEAGAGEWTNTADLINRLDMLSNANFAAGTRVLLYGSRN